MSSYFLPLGLAGTFGAVLLLGVAAEAWLAGRRRGMEVLRGQIKDVSVDLRQVELAEPFMDRALAPFVSRAGDLAKRVTPVGMRDRIARQLVLAGSPPGLTPEKVAATKVFGVVGGALLGAIMGTAFGFSGNLLVGTSVFFALFCYLIPGAGLGQRAIARQERIRRELPDTMDLLTISVEAGLSFDAALAHVRRRVPGPLSDEVGRMLQEMQLGVSRGDALRQLAERTTVEELKAFVLAMIQADIFGISVAKVLRSQARDLRTKRRQRAEEKAMKVPVKLLFPMIFCILPAMFVVLLGPGVIMVMRTLFGYDV